MARYIDADALIISIKNGLWDWDTLDDIKATSVLRQTITDIQNMPTVDVVEPVRCKDCQYHEDEEPGMVYCPHIVGGWVSTEAFCSDGERRE